MKNLRATDLKLALAEQSWRPSFEGSAVEVLPKQGLCIGRAPGAPQPNAILIFSVGRTKGLGEGLRERYLCREASRDSRFMIFGIGVPGQAKVWIVVRRRIGILGMPVTTFGRRRNG
jgi:hypothetical protein